MGNSGNKDFPKGKVSVIIPAYNSERFIRATLESVLWQTYPAYEIIVVDDASTDSTPRILESFGDKIIRKRLAVNTTRPGKPRNVGRKEATGDFIAFLDSDDIWFREKLQKQLEVFAKYPGVGFVCADYVSRLPYQNFRLKKHFSLTESYKHIEFDRPIKNAYRLLIESNFVGGPSASIVRKCVDDSVGDIISQIGYAEDYDYWLKCARITDFYVMSEVLVHKKIHDANLSNDTVNFYRRGANVLKEIIRKRDPYTVKNGLIGKCRLAMAKKYYNMGNRYFETGSPGSAFKTYFRGLFSSARPANMALFIWNFSKKVARLLSFNLISRERIKGTCPR